MPAFMEAAPRALVVQSLYSQNDLVWLCVGTVALLLFIFDAEKTADAVLADDPRRMVRYLDDLVGGLVKRLRDSKAALVCDLKERLLWFAP
jgi:hypothetical protein